MDYAVTFVRGSFDPTARELLKYQDFSEIEKIDRLFDGHDAEAVTICDVADYLLFTVHNENTANGNKDYAQLVLVTKEGGTYVTGSPSFIRDFETVFSILRAESEDAFDIKVRKAASKRYNGKYFLKLSIV